MTTSHKLGDRMRALRGAEPMTRFCRRLDLSYTFVRELERGNRLPSDPVIQRISERLHVAIGPILIDTYMDRSPLLEAWFGAPAEEICARLEAARKRRRRT